MCSLYADYSSVRHICAIWWHICSWTYANNIKCMYSSGHGHIVICKEFIWGIYTNIVVSCTHELIYVCSILRGIFLWPICGNSIWSIYLGGCVSAHISKNGEYICPCSIMPVWVIFAICGSYLFSDFKYVYHDMGVALVHVHTYLHLYMYTCTYRLMYVATYIPYCIHSYMHSCAQTFLHTYMCVYMQTVLWMSLHTYANTHAFNLACLAT